MTIDWEVVSAIMLIWGIGVVGIIEFAKKLLKMGKLANIILAFVVSAGATAAHLAMSNAFDWLPFIIYTVVVFGEATGLYWLRKKETPTL